MKHLCLVVVAAVLLPGCIIDADSHPDIVNAVQPKDIPVISGMNLKTHLMASDTLEVRDYKYANLVYEGEVPVVQVAAYLLERMPQHSYRLVSQDRSDNLERLEFQRGRYTSVCTISREDYRTRLEIKVRTHL